LGGGKLIWLDTLGWWRCPLAELGRAVGLPKGDMPGAQGGEGQWIDYCRQDVCILERAVQMLLTAVAELDLGNLSYTAPGQALRHFRHRGWGRDLVLHGHLHALTLEREAYYGGQFEAFYQGEVRPFALADARDRTQQYAFGHFPDLGPVHVLDRKSAYPTTMRDEQFPVALTDYQEQLSLTELERASRDAYMIASVKLDTPKETFPKRQKANVVYPVGKYWTVLSHPELVHALQRGYVRQVGRVAMYAAKPILQRYADFWLRQREIWGTERGVCWADLAKLFGNALHGKLGQRAYQWIDVPDDTPPVTWGYYYDRETPDGAIVRCRSIAGHAQREQKYETPLPEEVAEKDADAEEIRRRLGEAPFSAPAVAGAVTAYNRQWMREARDQAGARTVYHQAGDALCLNQDGYDRLQLAGLVRPGQAGFLQEKGRAEIATFWGLNDYELDGKATISGLPSGATWQERGAWTCRQFERVQSIIAGSNGNGHAGPNGTVGTVDVLVRRQRPVGPAGGKFDGWLKPLELEE